MEDLNGKTAFVTGASKGIGLGIARALAREGAKLALADIDREALQAVRTELSITTDVEVYELDVRDRGRFTEIANDVEGRLGPVAVLCNNAGVAGAFSLDQMNYDLWDLVVGTNLGGFINGVQTFLPRMLKRGEPGHLYFTSAGAGLAVGGGNTGYMYQTSKYGVMGLGESLQKQLEIAGHPIGVTILCPGPVPAHAFDTMRAALAQLPPGASPLPSNPTPEMEAAIAERIASFQALLDQGVPPDEVGEMAVAGIKANKLFIHTDRSLWDPLWVRFKALFDAMPARPAPSVEGLLNAEGRRAT